MTVKSAQLRVVRPVDAPGHHTAVRASDRRTLSVAQVQALPASFDLVTAGLAFGLGRTFSYQLAKAGKFPIPVLRLGRRYRCTKSDLLSALGLSNEGGSTC